jgi:hypothetical protein
MADSVEKQSFEGWAILELMGHRKLGGYVREEVVFGSAMCRIDIPAVDEYPAATQYYSAAALYSLTPCDEETARQVVSGFRPQPVTRWELPKPASAISRSREAYLGDPDDDENE